MRHQISELPRYQIVKEENKVIFRFFCELSGAAVFTSAPISTDTPEETLLLIWRQNGRSLFNRCGKCGKWVCDLMYNPDVFQCVDCAPWENKPHYCVTCGQKTSAKDAYCRKCGQRLRYKEVWA